MYVSIVLWYVQKWLLRLEELTFEDSEREDFSRFIFSFFIAIPISGDTAPTSTTEGIHLEILFKVLCGG